MGSRYWYFYRIDDEEEFVNPAQPTTRACPFLPGQEVNVLEVPKLIQRRASDASLDTEYTLDPRDKYAPLKSEESMFSMPHHSMVPPPSPQLPGAPHSRTSTLPRSIFSAGSLTSLHHSSKGKSRFSHWQPANISEQNEADVLQPSKQSPDACSALIATRRPATQPSAARRSNWSAFMLTRRPWSASRVVGWRLPHSLERASVVRFGNVQPAAQLHPSMAGESGKAVLDGLGMETGIQRAADGDVSVSQSEEPGKETQTHLSSLLPLTLPIGHSLDHGKNSLPEYFGTPFEQSSRRFGTADDATSPCTDHFAAPSERLTDWSSRYNGQAFSTSNDTSAMQSQPMTPLQTDFGADQSRPPSPGLELGEQSQGMYSLRTAERASALTLHTLQALPDDSATTPTRVTFKGTKPPNRRVEEWVDRSESTMEELCKDMGYLSSWID